MHEAKPTDIENLLLRGQVDNWIDANILRLLKAPVVFVLMYFSIYTLSGSPSKAALISVLSVVAGAFTAWRRLIEPFVVVMFAIATVAWCCPDLVARSMR